MLDAGSVMGGERVILELVEDESVAGLVRSAVMLEEEDGEKENTPEDVDVKWHVGGVEVWYRPRRNVSFDFRDSGNDKVEFVVVYVYSGVCEPVYAL